MEDPTGGSLSRSIPDTRMILKFLRMIQETEGDREEGSGTGKMKTLKPRTQRHLASRSTLIHLKSLKEGKQRLVKIHSMSGPQTWREDPEPQVSIPGAQKAEKKEKEGQYTLNSPPQRLGHLGITEFNELQEIVHSTP